MGLTRITSDGITDAAIVNADINASAAIAGTKISPDFGSQGVTTTGQITGNGVTVNGDITLNDNQPRINFTDNNGNPDYLIQVDGGHFLIHDATNGADKFKIQSDGHIDITPNVDFAQGIDVTGAITGTSDLTITGNASANAVQSSFGGITTRLGFVSGGAEGVVETTSNHSLVLGVNSSEKMRIDSSGNVGIGITPEAHHSTVTSLQIGGSTNLYDDSNFVILANNVYLDSSGNKRIKADEASRITQEAGKFFFERAGADSADSAITFQRIIATNEDGTVFLKGQATSDNNRMQIRVDDTLATVMASCNSGTERNIAFHTRNTGGSLAATITANGIAMPSGKGIDFSAAGNSSGMTSELLNDYEEGTWTPDLRVHNYLNNANSFTYTSRSGTYTKVGRKVHITGFFRISDFHTYTGNLYMFGLPFATLSGSHPLLNFVGDGVNLGGDNQMQMFMIIEGGNDRAVVGHQRNTGWSHLTRSELSGNGGMYVSGSYYV